MSVTRGATRLKTSSTLIISFVTRVKMNFRALRFIITEEEII